MSPLTQSFPKKSIILLVCIGIGIYLWITWKRLFSPPAIPREIQNWVQRNYGQMKTEHQHKITCLIATGKRLATKGASKGFFRGMVDFTDDFFFSVEMSSRLNRFASKEHREVISAVREYFRAAAQPSTPQKFIPAGRDEILAWINVRPGDLTEQQKEEAVKIVIEIESSDECKRNPKEHILALRRNITATVEVFRLKAIGYLTYKHRTIIK
jgi:hypothetical protein